MHITVAANGQPKRSLAGQRCAAHMSHRQRMAKRARARACVNNVYAARHTNKKRNTCRAGVRLAQANSIPCTRATKHEHTHSVTCTYNNGGSREYRAGERTRAATRDASAHRKHTRVHTHTGWGVCARSVQPSGYAKNVQTITKLKTVTA